MVPSGIKRNTAYQCYLFNSTCNNDIVYNINISFIPFCISCYFDVGNFDLKCISVSITGDGVLFCKASTTHVSLEAVIKIYRNASTR